ncbi:MAG: hydrogenase expression/formation protein HypE [Planctomycetaceae bacterium]|nr:hydrogenase expression/formation protein HypE [Planctomycetaceae bacterium]
MSGETSGCPLPSDDGGRVLLAHGEGAKLTRRLLDEHVFPRLFGTGVRPLEDAALLPPLSGAPVLATDSFVVSPLFFPGGDIGSLAVYGTVNDLLMRGARPLWLTLSMILEEGLPLSVLDRVLDRIAVAARCCDIAIVAGDTKVVPRGAADGLFLSTAGLGQLVDPAPTGITDVKPGDVVLVTGPIGRHGIAILSAREGLRFEPPPTSDCAPLTAAVVALRNSEAAIRGMRDATRGGVTAVLHEWSRDSGLTLFVDERRVPITPEVRGACELLGLDALSVANEGTMVAVISPDDVNQALAALRNAGYAGATAIGEVRSRGVVPVVVSRALGREQPLIEPSGAPLPRIC